MALTAPSPLIQAPLEASSEALLRGREREVETLVRNAQLSRLTLITAAPGLGLTSLLRAGAVPALQRAEFITVVYSDWQGRYFAAQLREAIAAAVRDQTGSHFVAEPGSLEDLLAAAHRKTGRLIALIFDQFEDYLRCQAGADIADYFDADLANAVCARDGRFIIGVQAHAVSDLDHMSPSIPNLFGHRLNLAPLSADAAVRIVRDRDIRLDSESARELTKAPDVGGRHGVNPFSFLLAAGRAAEGMESEHMVTESLDEFLGNMSPEQSQLFFRWLPLFFSPLGHRQAVVERKLFVEAGRAHKVATPLLPALVKTGLLRTVEMGGRCCYELARESLVVILKDWWERREQVEIARRRVMARIRWISVAAGALVTVYFVYSYLRVNIGDLSALHIL